MKETGPNNKGDRTGSLDSSILDESFDDDAGAKPTTPEHAMGAGAGLCPLAKSDSEYCFARPLPGGSNSLQGKNVGLNPSDESAFSGTTGPSPSGSRYARCQPGDGITSIEVPDPRSDRYKAIANQRSNGARAPCLLEGGA